MVDLLVRSWIERSNSVESCPVMSDGRSPCEVVNWKISNKQWKWIRPVDLLVRSWIERFCRWVIAICKGSTSLWGRELKEFTLYFFHITQHVDLLVKWTHLSRHFFKKIKLDFGRDNPILFLPCLPTKCGYMSCQGCAAEQLPKEPFTAHISALTLLGRERQDNYLSQ